MDRLRGPDVFMSSGVRRFLLILGVRSLTGSTLRVPRVADETLVLRKGGVVRLSLACSLRSTVHFSQAQVRLFCTLSQWDIVLLRRCHRSIHNQLCTASCGQSLQKSEGG